MNASVRTTVFSIAILCALGAGPGQAQTADVEPRLSEEASACVTAEPGMGGRSVFVITTVGDAGEVVETLVRVPVRGFTSAVLEHRATQAALAAVRDCGPNAGLPEGTYLARVRF